MSSGKDLVFIVGRQRSGTTVIRELFSSHGALDAEEIFHGTLNHKYRFYEFVYQAVQQDKSLIYPIHHKQLFHQYIDFLRSESKGAPVVLDVKYFAFNLLSSSYSLMPPQPFVAEYIRNTQAHVVHVVRQNKLRIYVSECLSEKTGVWAVAKKSEIPQDRQLKVDVEHMFNALEQLEQQANRAEKVVGALPNVHLFHYEELFDAEGNFREQIGEVVKGIMGVGQVNLRPSTIRMNSEPLSDIIQNYGAVQKRLAGTPYEWMLTAE